MIPQDIVISPDVIEKIKNDFMDLDLKSYWRNLRYKRLVFDKGKEGIVFEEIRKLLVGAHKLIVEKVHKEILDSVRFANRVKFIEIKDTKDYSKNKINNILLNLTLLTESKILNIEDIAVKELIIPKFDELKELELLSIQESIEPPVESKIFNADRSIYLYFGDEYKIHFSLEHYFTSTETLIICDKYVIDKNSGYKFLFYILNICNNLKKLEIWTKFDDNMKNFATKEELINDLDEHINKNDLKLKYVICNTLRNQHRRHMYTDCFDIKSDVGLNFIDLNYKVIKSDTDIIIKEKNVEISRSIEKVKNIIKANNLILHQNYQ